MMIICTLNAVSIKLVGVKHISPPLNYPRKI
jgi:hypothetical protein